MLSNYNCFQQFEVRFLFEGNISAPPPFFPFKRFSLKFLVAKINNLIKTFYGLHINCNGAKIIARCFHYYYFYYKLFIFTIIIYFNYIIRIKAAKKKIHDENIYRRKNLAIILAPFKKCFHTPSMIFLLNCKLLRSKFVL